MVIDAEASGAVKGGPRNLTAGKKIAAEKSNGKPNVDFDSSVEEFVWAGNDKILFSAEAAAMTVLFTATLEAPTIAAYTSITPPPTEGAWKSGTISALSLSNDGHSCAFSRSRLDQPAEAYVSRLFTKDDKQDPSLVSKTINVSQANAKLLAELDLGRPESVTVAGAGGVPMQMWILKPPGFDDKKKWPLAFLVHGGPQGAWEDGWSYRWNPEVWAAQGYVVALPNPRGSTGFGQKYVDEITADWGGKCYGDLMEGVDYLEKLPYIDKDRMGAAGGSFGGYMMNWFAVNTGRFKTPHHPLRRLEFRQHVRHDRRALVRRVGARRPALGQESRVLREALAAQVRRQSRQVQDADAGHPQRSRFPLPDRAGA